LKECEQWGECDGGGICCSCCSCVTSFRSAKCCGADACRGGGEYCSWCRSSQLVAQCAAGKRHGSQCWCAWTHSEHNRCGGSRWWGKHDSRHSCTTVKEVASVGGIGLGCPSSATSSGVFTNGSRNQVVGAGGCRRRSHRQRWGRHGDRDELCCCCGTFRILKSSVPRGASARAKPGASRDADRSCSG
jgi:hypothetical protein